MDMNLGKIINDMRRWLILRKVYRQKFAVAYTDFEIGEMTIDNWYTTLGEAIDEMKSLREIYEKEDVNRDVYLLQLIEPLEQ